ncbi:energy-coupling factor transporter transmembrane protein EcfT [Lysinibacillus sp. CD3-6]|uniref:energy-coupling factor transporter transmembrane component T family protein n=1 Tax=Lysinibacillus sp. CD3-6 TaxID=2892541 RepID=UPI00116DEF10|nr:energy-coupling factor transporter transmembrane component T [Lysinibacillus sp. CD3-6]UED78338.1 energy-coupling factor transporter transmembrane protein EcfT [Lysinibacillus sp. CD3-6]
MRSSIIIGQYVDKHSIFHQLDPRIKIISIFMLMLSFLLLDTATSYVITTFFVFTLIIVSKVPFVVILKGLKPLLFILSFTLIYHLLFTQGQVIWSIGFITISLEGMVAGIRFVWRILLLVLLASLLTLTTKPLILAKGLEKLLKPLSKLRVPIEQFSLMIVIAIRFIPTVLEELNRIVLAQKSRGFDIKSLPFMQRIFAYVPIVIPLLFTTVQRADQLSDAIDARGYGDGKNRTSYIELHFEKKDFIAMLVTILFVLVLFFIKWSGI